MKGRALFNYPRGKGGRFWGLDLCTGDIIFEVHFKNTHIMKKLVYAAVSLLMITGCAKDGETGPAGPAGANGAANVKTITWTAGPSSWTTIGTPGNSDHSKSHIKTWIDLSQDVIDNGLVITYLSDGSSISPIPISVPITGGTTVNFTPYYSVGQIEILVQLSNFQTPNTSTSILEWRTVIVPPIERIKHPEINWNDYNQVANAFHLE